MTLGRWLLSFHVVVTIRASITVGYVKGHATFVGVIGVIIVPGGSSSAEYPSIRHPLVTKLFQFFIGGVRHISPRVRINKTG